MRKIYVIEESSRVVRPDGVYNNRLGAPDNLYFNDEWSAISKAREMASEDGYMEVELPYYSASSSIYASDEPIKVFVEEQTYDDKVIYNYIKVYECNIY